jgi:uncharacterized protein YdeI (BOF family)
MQPNERRSHHSYSKKDKGAIMKIMAIAVASLAIMCTGAFAQSGTESGQGSTMPNSAAVQGSDSSQTAVTLVDPAKIYSESPMNWVGKSVTLQNVAVQDTNDSGNFWVGTDNDHRLLVVRQKDNDNLKAMKVHKRDVVTISGTVEAASRYRANETSAESGSMHDAEKTSGVFLLANTLTVSSSTHK